MNSTCARTLQDKSTEADEIRGRGDLPRRCGRKIGILEFGDNSETRFRLLSTCVGGFKMNMGIEQKNACRCN